VNRNWVFFIVDFETTGLDAREHYPIEVGGLFTDSNFTVLDKYESFIKWPDLEKEIIVNGYSWPPKYSGAYLVHKIDAPVCTGLEKKDIKLPEEVAGDLQYFCKEYKRGKRNPIMVSDNAQFEHSFMKKIFESSEIDFPFHYCTWDTSMFLELSGIGDPVGVHRAFPDASLLHNALMRARGKLDLEFL